MAIGKRLRDGLENVERHAAVVSTTSPDWFPQLRKLDAARVKSAVNGVETAYKALRDVGSPDFRKESYGNGSVQTDAEYTVHRDVHAAPCLPSEETVSQLKAIAFGTSNGSSDVDEDGLVGILNRKHEDIKYHESNAAVENKGGDETIETLFNALESPLKSAYNVLTAGYDTLARPDDTRPNNHPYLTMLSPVNDKKKHYEAVRAVRQPR